MKIINEKYNNSVSVGLQQMVGINIGNDKQISAYNAENRIHIKSIQNLKAIHSGYFKPISRISE